MAIIVSDGPGVNQSTESKVFPNPLIPREDKDFKYHLKYVLAAWREWRSTQRGSLYLAQSRYSHIMAYLQGEQHIGQYQNMMEIEDEAGGDKGSSWTQGDSREFGPWVTLNWKPVKWLVTIKNMVIAKISKRDYTVTFNAIDQLAEEEKERVLTMMEARLKIRETLERVDPNAVSDSQFSPLPGEPEDHDELELMRTMTFKHNMARQAEQAVDVVLNDNNYNLLRRQLKEEWFAFGVAGVKTCVENGKVRVRKVDISQAMTSPCSLQNYSDCVYWGELRRMRGAELMEEAGDQFTAEEWKTIIHSFMDRRSTPAPVNDDYLYNQFRDQKIEVLDLEWLDVDSLIFEKRENAYGNPMLSRSSVERMARDKSGRSDYTKKNFEVLRKASWIVGSEWIYNWGLCTNMARKKNSMHKVIPNFHFFAIDFYRNRVVSPAEILIEHVDTLQLLWMKYQFLITKLRADGLAIAIGALEDISLGAGGQNFQPLDVLDLFNQTGYLYYRRENMAGQPVNYMPIEQLRTENGQKMREVWSQIMEHFQFVKHLLGFNEATDGSSYDPRALKTAIAAADEATNNAFNNMVNADRWVMESVASKVLVHIQSILKNGGAVEGYVTALGRDTQLFFTALPELYLYDFGMKLSDIPTDEERAILAEEAKQWVAADLLDMEDLAVIKNAVNLKEAQAILSLKIKRRKKEKQEEQQKAIQMNGQVQQESAMVASQMKMQELQMEHQMKLEQIQLEKEWDYKIAALKEEGALAKEQVGAHASLIRQGVATESKEEIARQKQQPVQQNKSEAPEEE